MALQCIYDTGDTYKVQPSYDGGVNQAYHLDCVVGHIGDEFAITYSSNSLDITFNAGSEARIGGAWAKVVSSTSKTLTANSTIYLTIRIDKSQANGSRAFFQECSSANMVKGWINGADDVRDLLLYVITTSASGVSSVVDKRMIDNGCIMMYESEYEALATKDSHTFYDVISEE